MKKSVLLLIITLIASTSYSQWNQVGQDIYGEVAGLMGTSVSINGDGNRMALFDGVVNGDPGGMLRVFDLQNSMWVEIGDGVMGFSGDANVAGPVKLNDEGNRFIFSSPSNNSNGINDSGIVRVFEYNEGNWVQLGQSLYGENEGDYFGAAIDISNDGETIVVGATQHSGNNNYQGYVKVFSLQNGSWIALGNNITGEYNGDLEGAAVSISSDGTRIGSTAPGNDTNGNNSGQLRVFDLQNNQWVQIGNSIYGVVPNDRLGQSLSPGATPLSLNSSGNKLAIGCGSNNADSGYVKIFEYQNNNWLQIGDTIFGEEENFGFGYSLNLNNSGTILFASDPLYLNATGLIKVYKVLNNDWEQIGAPIYGNEIAGFFGMALESNALGNMFVLGAFGSNGNGNSSGVVRILQNDNILSTLDIKTSNNISLYPNPNNGNFSLKFSESISELQISINDISGKQVYIQKYSDSENININQTLASGLYFVTIYIGVSKTTLKMIVK